MLVLFPLVNLKRGKHCHTFCAMCACVFVLSVCVCVCLSLCSYTRKSLVLICSQHESTRWRKIITHYTKSAHPLVERINWKCSQRYMWEILPCCTYVLLPSKFSFAQNDYIAFNFWQSRKSKANYTLTACKFDDAVWMPCIIVECRLRQHQHQHQRWKKKIHNE